MTIETKNAIINGLPGVIIQVEAAALRECINGIWQQAKAEAAAEREAEKERPTMSRNEAAHALGVTLATLWRWAKDGYLVPAKIGTKVLYRASDINALLERNKLKGRVTA